MINSMNPNITLRNIQQQVQKNKEDIARHYKVDRALANFGIKVVGQVDTAADLPPAETYTGDYGDAYAVGYRNEVEEGTSTYTYYIFTRPDLNAGYPNNHWLDVGQLGIKGDKGDTGPEGPQGKRGAATTWWVATDALTTENPDYKVGDFALAANGGVYILQENNGVKRWIKFTNIQGPQGVQGPRGLQGEKGDTGPKGVPGDRGPAGRTVKFIGTLASSNELNNYSPTVINDLSAAFLIGDTISGFNLWVQVGTAPSNAVWTDMGPLNGGTVVSDAQGNVLTQWNTDDAVLRFPKEEGRNRLYSCAAGANRYTTAVYYNTIPTSYALAQYGRDGNLKAADPYEGDHVATKQYVDKNHPTMIIYRSGTNDSITMQFINVNGNSVVLELYKHETFLLGPGDFESPDDAYVTFSSDEVMNVECFWSDFDDNSTDRYGGDEEIFVTDYRLLVITTD